MTSGFSEQEVELITNEFSIQKIAKGEFFVEENKVNRHLAFVESGYFYYYINLDGEEKTTYSIGENNIMISLISYLKEEASKENIKAVVDSNILIIEKVKFDALKEQIVNLKNFYISLLEYQICCIDESRLDALMLSPEQRYIKLIEKEGAILQNIPLSSIASILGISQRHLSRIRNNIRL